MTFVTLVTGPSSETREQAIAGRLDPDRSTVALLEGFPSGNSFLEAQAFNPKCKVLRIAAGCMCCTGNLVMRVTLNRILRDPPEQLFLSISDASHVEALRFFLSSAPYDRLLTLTEDCCT